MNGIRDCFRYTEKGRPPSAPVKAQDGTTGGKVSLLLDYSKHQGYPLLLAMGGNGEKGLEGGKSPLCQGNQYMPAKEDNPYFEPWDQLNFLGNAWEKWNAPKKLPKSDHHVNAGNGGQGGDSGSGSVISVVPVVGDEWEPGVYSFQETFVTQKNFFVAPGHVDARGPSGTCGPRGDLGTLGSDAGVSGIFTDSQVGEP